MNSGFLPKGGYAGIRQKPTKAREDKASKTTPEKFSMARTTVAAQLASIRKQQALLAKKAKALTERTQGKAMEQIKRLAKDNGITAEDIAAALKGGRPAKAASGAPRKAAAKAAGRKVAPKYRNPSNPSETWAGRGRAPAWAQAMKNAGTLDQALIK